MSRLIDADALEAEFAGRPPDWYSTGTILRSIVSAPTIDAVPVVRCSQCKHRMHLEGATDVAWECALRYGLPGVIAEEDYCSYGKRKEDDHD